jgi:hypothetical protein
MAMRGSPRISIDESRRQDVKVYLDVTPKYSLIGGDTPEHWETAAMIERPPPLEFSYGVVEKALAIAYGIPEAVRPAGFRSMLSSLQKLGVLGLQSRVGRGAKLTYTHIEFERLILALELLELGLPPAVAVGLISRNWESKLKAIIGVAQEAFGLVPEKPRGDDVMLCLVGGGFRTASLRGETGPSVPIIERTTLDELAAAMRLWMTTPLDDGVRPPALDDPAPPRVLVVNLSARLRAFHAALGVEYLAEAVAERRAALAGNEPPPKAQTAPELK